MSSPISLNPQSHKQRPADEILTGASDVFKRTRFSVLVCRKWKLVNLQANVCCINYRSTFYFWSFEWWPTHQTLIKEVLENENLSPAADFLPQMFSEKQFSCRRERWLTCCFCIVRMEAEQGGTTTGIVIRSFLWTCWLFCCVFEPLFPAGVSLGWREQTGRVAEVLAGLLRAARLKNPALMKPSNVSCIQVWCMRMERRHASTRPVRSAQPRDTRCGCWGK